MVKQDAYQEGSIAVVDILFEEIGDVLSMHSHPIGAAHLTFIRSGRFLITRETPPIKKEFGPGSFLKFLPDELHEYKALEPMSLLKNIVY